MKPAIVFLIPIALFGQMRDNRDKEMTCQGWNYNRQAHHCEIREQTLASQGRISADPGVNGGVTIKGRLRNDVLVRSRIEAWGDNDAEAVTLMKQVQINLSGGSISTAGPADVQQQHWAVSFEIFVPRITNVDLKTYNGGAHLSDIEGTIDARTTNGGIHLARIAGDVKGATVNGGVHVELVGSIWQGRQLELSTINGGVTVSMPEGYSAHLRAETNNGRIRSDVPVIAAGAIRPRTLDANIGSGGPLIHLSTQNGGIRMLREGSSPL